MTGADPSANGNRRVAQRSLDAAGGQSTVDRNPTGFRFLVDGNGLLLVGEAGYQRSSSAWAPQAWFRAGYFTDDLAAQGKTVWRSSTSLTSGCHGLLRRA